MDPANMKGPKVSTGRFYSFCKAHRLWDPYRHTKVFIIAFVAIRQRWITSYDQLFRNMPQLDHGVLPSRSTSMASSSTSTLPPQEASASRTSASGPSSSSSSATASASAATTASGASPSAQDGGKGTLGLAKVKEGTKALMDEERGRSANTLHAVGRLLADHDLTRQTRMVNLAANPLAI
eukprot:4086996-Lingulodinium_polyedra.AAC.1